MKALKSLLKDNTLQSIYELQDFITEQKAIIYPRHFEVLNNTVERGKIIEYVASGGRVSGKTQFVCGKIIETVREMEGQDVICLRADARDLNTTCKAAIIKLICQAGLQHEFDMPISQLYIRHIPTGNMIYFRAYEGSINRTKGDEPKHNVKLVWVEEANEARSSMVLDGAISTYERFMKDGGKIIYTFNPAQLLTHWSHSYFNNIAIKAGNIHLHCTYNNVARLITPAVLTRILHEKKHNELFWRYWYMGECVSLEGLVFFTYDRSRHVINADSLASLGMPMAMYYGVDDGVSRDATAVTAWAIFPSKMVALSTFYHDPSGKARDKAPKIADSVKVTKIESWYNALQLEFGGQLPKDKELWIGDCDAKTQGLLLEIQLKMLKTVKTVDKKNVDADIKRGQNLFYNDQIAIYESSANAVAIREIESYTYDENNKIPEGQADHFIKEMLYVSYDYYYNVSLPNMVQQHHGLNPLYKQLGGRQ